MIKKDFVEIKPKVLVKDLTALNMELLVFYIRNQTVKDVYPLQISLYINLLWVKIWVSYM